MCAEHIERRLAAILAADVVGYSRLMQANEERTLSTLRQHRREAFVMDSTGEKIDESILVGSLVSDDTFDDRFPVTNDVPERTKGGARNIGIKKKFRET